MSIFTDVLKNFRYIFYHYSPHLVRKFMQLRKWFCQQKMTGRKISPSWHFAAAAYGNLRRRSIPPQTKLHLGFMRDFPAKNFRMIGQFASKSFERRHNYPIYRFILSLKRFLSPLLRVSWYETSSSLVARYSQRNCQIVSSLHF